MSLDLAKTMLLLTAFSAPASAYCPKNSIPAAKPGSCFFVLDEWALSYNRAKRFCEEYFDGTLASVTSAIDNWNIMLMARDTASSSIWLGGYFDGMNVTWEDGSSAQTSYTNFQNQGQNPGNIVVQLANGIWTTATYNSRYPFVCTAKNTTSKTFCPKKSVTSADGGSCYFPANITYTYNRAQRFCSNFFGANLASISSSQDNQIVLRAARDAFGDDNVNIWLGGIFNGDSVIWEDGTPNSYTNFQNAKPNIGYNFYMDLTTGKWQDASYTSGFPFMCKTHNVPQPSPPGTTPSTPTTKCAGDKTSASALS